MHVPGIRQFTLSLAFGFLAALAAQAQEKVLATGPETEKRFPSLRVPDGFRATLFACDPLIEYPSAIALGPRAGTVFVAIDYMTGLGTDILRRDEIRLVEDSNGDGYADRAAVYAGKFNSIQGLTFHGGIVYVMHAPFLTALRDVDGDGKADERRDLLKGLGLTPEENPVRLHCANGLVMGHDGWLYLALGDHGCDVQRPEGDRLVLHGGGILRCRPDGRDLHVFARGLRNIYDVALDRDLNVFVRDNENDGGNYKIRVCHSFFGADHGYPYLYEERPDEALPPRANLGLGSSAGGLAYLESAFPAEYRGNLFFCEWGRAIVRYLLSPVESSFAPAKELEFASAASDDPYGFKPTDLVVDRDGSLIAADWADGQRPKRGRGRIYRIRFEDDSAGSLIQAPKTSVQSAAERSPGAHWISQLDAPSYYERIDAQASLEHWGHNLLSEITKALGNGELAATGRSHAVWILAHLGGQNSIEPLLRLARSDPEPGVRVQAIRAVADLSDPVFTQHHLNADRGDDRLAQRLAAGALDNPDPRVVLESVIALGRLRWSGAPDWLRHSIKRFDSTLAHAAMQTLRRSGNWSAVLAVLDEPDDESLRAIAVRALADQPETEIVDGLIERIQREKNPHRRSQYGDLLSRVHRQPGPWSYWGYRPGPRPANTAPWARTESIELALNSFLTDPDSSIRLAMLRRMQRENIPARPAALTRWLGEERDARSVSAILESTRGLAAASVRSALASVVVQKNQELTNRMAALTIFAGGLDAESEAGLLELSARLEDGPLLAASLQQMALRFRLHSTSYLLAKLNSPQAVVRSAAVEALADLKIAAAGDAIRARLDDPDSDVRLAAARAAGALQIGSASEPLLAMAQDANAQLRRTSLESLRRLKERRAIPLAVAALRDRDTQSVALDCLHDLGGLDQLKPVFESALRDPLTETLLATLRLLTHWKERRPEEGSRQIDKAIAELQGNTGQLLRWNLAGPVRGDNLEPLAERIAASESAQNGATTGGPNQQTIFAAGPEARVTLPSAPPADGPRVWLLWTEFQTTDSADVQFLPSGVGPIRVWLNGRVVHQRDDSVAVSPNATRFDGRLNAGVNRVVVAVASGAKAEFALRIRRKSAVADHERLIEASLRRVGNPERGRTLFFDVERSQCLKCHRLNGQGEPIGPELTGLGSRFSRIHIIESILEPSRSIAPSFQPVDLILEDGTEWNGIVLAETDRSVTLADRQGQKHVVARNTIKDRRIPLLSIMPEGLEKNWSVDEFVDLVAFLSGLKSTSTP